jgi:hypothetical protein
LNADRNIGFVLIVSDLALMQLDASFESFDQDGANPRVAGNSSRPSEVSRMHRTVVVGATL